MGVNQTCAISQFPIGYGDPVVGLLLIETGNDIGHLPRGFSGTSPLWSIASLPFFGTYEDGGLPELQDVSLADSKALRVGGKSIDEFFEHWSESNDDIQVKTYTGQIAAVRFVLMHREIWDKIAERPIGFIGKTTYEAERDTLPAILDHWLAATAERWSNGVLASIPDHERPLLDMVSDLRDTWWRSGHENKRAKGIRFFSTEYAVHHRLAMGVMDHLNELIKAGDRDAAVSVLEECMRVAIVDEAMDKLNKQWIPQVLGTDEKHVDLHAELAQWTLKMVAEEKAKYDEDWDDEDETSPPAP